MKFDCMSCQLVKQTVVSFKNNISLTFMPFELVHSNVWSHTSIVTIKGFVILLLL